MILDICEAYAVDLKYSGHGYSYHRYIVAIFLKLTRERKI